jgi:hypothetical protein
LLFVSFIPHKHFGIQLQNFLLAIAAPSRRTHSVVQAISGCNLAQAAVGAGDDVVPTDDFSQHDRC